MPGGFIWLDKAVVGFSVNLSPPTHRYLSSQVRQGR
jgi:hypothetical protein